MKSIFIKIFFFLKTFAVSIICLIIVGRYLGFTPKQHNPIPWKELFEDKLGFILIFSFTLSLIGVIFESNNNKNTKK